MNADGVSQMTLVRRARSRRHGVVSDGTKPEIVERSSGDAAWTESLVVGGFEGPSGPNP